MRDADAFLAAVLARPDDDLPRLIFADWLDEHGAADRAEFIRLQCGAARGDPAALVPAAVRRAAELEAAHRAAWAAPLGGQVLWAGFRRGFVEHVALDARTFLRDGAALRRLAPIRSVALLKAGHVLDDLLGGPHLRGLTGLHLTGGLLQDEGVARLAASPHLGDLTALKLGQTAVGDAGAAALAGSPHLGRLRTLVLRENAIGDAGAWDLARSPGLGGLQFLDLAENEIGPVRQAALKAAFPRVDVSRQRDVSRWRRPAVTAAGRSRTPSWPSPPRSRTP